MSNETAKLYGVAEFVELSSVITDYGKSSKNSALMAHVNLPYWDAQDGTAKMSGIISGYMTSGFGWNIQNTYEDLLPVTGLQQNLTRFAQGGSALVGAIQSATGWNLGGLGNLAEEWSGKTIMSLQQTISVWMSMQKPNFNVSLLFFDGKGDSSTDVTSAAYIIERALYPKVGDTLDQSGTFNLTMNAPGGYKPAIRNDNNRGNANKTFGLTCEGLAQLTIGQFAFFPEVICTGASFQYSDRMLNNGKPQWLNVTLNFTMWRQPTLGDLAYRYLR